jgi:hypothetical protein
MGVKKRVSARFFLCGLQTFREEEMVADTDLQVWLDMHASAAQTVIVPYVRSARDAHIAYRMEVIQSKGGSMARISQNGVINATAAIDTPLTRIALSVPKEGECRVELTVNEEGKDADIYHFDCVREN